MLRIAVTPGSNGKLSFSVNTFFFSFFLMFLISQEHINLCSPYASPEQHELFFLQSIFHMASDGVSN